MSAQDLRRKVKTLLGMGDTLCDKCDHWRYCSDRRNPCEDCQQYGGGYYCKCSDSGTDVKECRCFKPIQNNEKE